MTKTTGGIYLNHLKHEVITPALNYINLGGQRAINQVTGTFLVEGYACNYTYLRQLGKGPALGPCQMEPVTYHDIWDNYLNNAKRQPLRSLLMHIAGDFNLDNRGIPKPETLTGNLFFAAAMCRVFYIRIREILPDSRNATAMAQYHKKYYNTALGKADWQKNIDRFQQAIDC